MAIFRVAHFVEIRCCHMGSGYTAIHASDFRDFLLLKRKILFGIVHCGFEHPSEVQYGRIPQAIFGTDHTVAILAQVWAQGSKLREAGASLCFR